MSTAYNTEKNPKLIVTWKVYILRGFIGAVLIGTLFFIAAGRFDIPRGWIYSITTAIQNTERFKNLG